VAVAAGAAKGAKPQPVVDALLLVRIRRVLEFAPLHRAPAAPPALGHLVLVLHVQKVALVALVADALDPKLAHHALVPGIRRLSRERHKSSHRSGG